MIINFFKKITSTMRYRNRLLVFSNKFNKNSKYMVVTRSKSGRNNTGTQTIYNKKNKIRVKTPVFNFRVPFLSKFFYLK